VLLAHPERCAQLAAKPQLCDKLIESGVYFQVNWDSFLGHHGRTTQKMAIYLAARGYIHCLATDSHDSISRNAIQVQRTAETIEELMGPRDLQIISRENPIRVMRNEALMSMEKSESVTDVKKIRRFRRLRELFA
jgi:protein-tyrosine phosphatase